MFIHKINEDTFLKILEIRDAEPLFALIDRSRDHLRQWLPWVDSTQTVEDSRAFIESTMKQFANNNGCQAGIWYKRELAGVIGFHQIDWSNRSTSIGYWLGQEFQGYGLMTESCRIFVNYAFHNLGLNRVEIRAATENKKSRAIPERLGFQMEGCIRQGQWLYDHFVDLVVYGILAEEWTNL